MKLFITGIGTDVGKTVVSAIFVKALQAAYWKPIHCGPLDARDSDTVRSLVAQTELDIYPEAYALPDPVSPHLAAARQGYDISLETMTLPSCETSLVVEGCGGLLVPINRQETILDLIKRLACPVVVVSSCYLGSLNHTFLTLEVLRQHDIPIVGLVFNGTMTPGLEALIPEKTSLPVLLHIDANLSLTPAVIAEYAAELRRNLHHHGLIELG